MKIHSYLSAIVLGALLLSAVPTQAQRMENRGEVKASERFAKTNLYRVANHSEKKLYHGIVATFSGIYYSGDIIKPNYAFKYMALPEQFGGSVTLNYKLTLNVYVSMRFGAQVGLLRGTNKKALDAGNVTSLHQFQSVFMEPYAGVEVYPILNYGFFLCACVGLAGSVIDYKHQRNSAMYEGQKQLGIVPMAQFGLGYNWWLTQDWTLGVELLGQIGMCDGQRYGLDGWPSKNAFNLGTEAGQQAYRDAKLPDGFVQAGIVLSYHFQ